MLINWFTVVAQAINFLILVWLLKRFLYKPIRRAIDEREKGIASQLAQAEERAAEAQKERDGFQSRSEVFDRERAALWTKATAEATAERERLVGEARADADALRAKWQDALRNEQRNLNQEVIRWTQKQVFDITRKALADLAGASLEERMSAVFVARLRALTGGAKNQLAAALKTSTQPARVTSAFELPPSQRVAIESAVKEVLAADTQIQFQTAPELISGIELSASGHKVAWSIADYLATLEKSAGELLREDAKPETKPDAKALAVRKVEPKRGPKRDPQNGPAPAAAAPKADH
jgi:F-type H+-transporting ATPase subunit b